MAVTIIAYHRKYNWNKSLALQMHRSYTFIDVTYQHFYDANDTPHNNSKSWSSNKL